MGLDLQAAGEFFLDGKPLNESSVACRIARGVALIPKDRKQDGLVHILSEREAIALPSLKQFTRGFHLDLKAKICGARDFIKRLGIKVSSPRRRCPACRAAISRRS